MNHKKLLFAIMMIFVGDVMEVLSFKIQPLEPFHSISCFVKTPVHVQAHVTFLSESLRDAVAQQNKFHFNAFVSVDPLLDIQLDDEAAFEVTYILSHSKSRSILSLIILNSLITILYAQEIFRKLHSFKPCAMNICFFLIFLGMNCLSPLLQTSPFQQEHVMKLQRNS